MSTDAFAVASRAAFAVMFPHIVTRLDKTSTAGSSVMMRDGEAADICVDGQPIYGGDARRFAADQVTAFIAKPLRIFVQRLDLSGIVSPVGQGLLTKIDDATREKKIGGPISEPTGNPTFLIVFGLGLGHHLEELLRRTKARWLLLVEPLLEFFEHSFHVVDWAKLNESIESKGGGLFVSTEMDPGQMVGQLAGFMERKGIPYADGSWVFTHYPFWAFSEARDRLQDSIEFNFINRGFFEDELVMLTNTVENCATREFWLLDARPRLRRPETVAVVGSGPSLDEGVATLHRIRDHIVLFSAGTALRALLNAGLVPDFHCELENGPQVYEVLSEAAKLGDLSQITLIAPTTVDPRVSALFGETIFYLRDSVSSTQILKGKHREIYGTSPTCVNLALVMAGSLGFTELVLFGTDCGVRAGGRHHAAGTVYQDVDVWQQRERQHYEIEVPGNFGGVVRTDLIYDACRVMMVTAIRNLGLSVLNCSDGAQIEGALPRVPEALEIAKPAVDMAALRAELERGMSRYAPGKFLEAADFGALRPKVEQLFADLDALLTKLDGDEPDFAATYDGVMGFVVAAKDRYGYTESIICGSLQALPRIAMYHGFRLVAAADRRRFHRFFIAEFRAINLVMSEQIYALLDRLGAVTPSSPNGVLAQTG